MGVSSWCGEERERDFLCEYLAQAPAALALVRAIECRQLARFEWRHPVLDLGCGDGLFAEILGVRSDVGLDRSARELRSAARRSVHRALVCGDVAALPFEDNSFATILANGVLEHVRDLARGLREIARVLQPEGRLVFTVPLVQEALQPGGAPSWVGLGLRKLAWLHARVYNWVFGQINMYGLRQWEELLLENGLALVHQHTYNPIESFCLHNLALLASLPCLLWKRLMGRWILFPALRRATWGALWAGLFRRSYLRGDMGPGVCLLGVAKPLKRFTDA